MDNELILGYWSSHGIFLLIISVISNLVKTVMLTALHNSSLPNNTPIRGMGILLFFTIGPLIGIFINDGIIPGILSIILVWGSSLLIPFVYKP
jgi:hypothetical protein